MRKGGAPETHHIPDLWPGHMIHRDLDTVPVAILVLAHYSLLVWDQLIDCTTPQTYDTTYFTTNLTLLDHHYIRLGFIHNLLFCYVKGRKEV